MPKKPRRKRELTARELAAMGGKAAARNSTPQQRSERARAAAVARWAKVKAEAA